MIRSSVPTLAAGAVLAALGAASSAFAQPPQHYVATPIPAHLVPVQSPAPGDGPGGPDMDWNTLDNNGGPLTNGGLLLEGTVGQPDPGILTGGAFEFGGGFWALLAEPPVCWVNCDDSTQAPILNIADFTCFLNRFAGGDLYANCDGSTQAPVLNVADFSCFLNKFASGCP